MGVAEGALGPWSILCRQPFLQLCKKVLLRLNEHGDVIIEMQTECLATYVILAPFGTEFGYFWIWQP